MKAHWGDDYSLIIPRYLVPLSTLPLTSRLAQTNPPIYAVQKHVSGRNAHRGETSSTSPSQSPPDIAKTDTADKQDASDPRGHGDRLDTPHTGDEFGCWLG